MMTRGATQFVTPLTFRALSGNKVYVDIFEGGSSGAEFEGGSMLALDLPDDCLGGILASYSIIHLPWERRAD